MIEIGSRVEVLSSVYPNLIGSSGTVVAYEISSGSEDLFSVRFDSDDPSVIKRYDDVENFAVSQEELLAVIFSKQID